MRSILIATGAITLGAIWLGPLPRLAADSFAAHMGMHMGVVAVGAGLLGAGIAGSRYDPARKAPGLLAPIPASIVELVVVWAWHAPALHHFARHSSVGLVVEQSLFLVSGLLVWVSAFGGPTPRQSARSAAGVIGLLLTSMHMTLLGALLALSPRVLYAHGDHAHGGLTALQDQHLGGVIMLFVGGACYLAGGLWLTSDALSGSKEKLGVQ